VWPTSGRETQGSFSQDPKHKNFRYDIIRMWRDIGLSGEHAFAHRSAPTARSLLGRATPAEGMVERLLEIPEHQTDRRRDIYGEVYAGVCALRAFRDPRAKEVLELTRKRWLAINFDNKQIVEECDAALREFVAK